MTHYVQVVNDEITAYYNNPADRPSGEGWYAVDGYIDPGSVSPEIIDGVLHLTPRPVRPSFNHVWDQDSSQWVMPNETLIRIQWGQIKAIRDQLNAIVTIDDGWRIDVDVESMMTMNRRISQWGVGTNTMTPDGRQMWKGADNDLRYFTQTEFTEFVADVEQKQALKVDANFAYAEYIRAQLPVADDHPVFNPDNWPG